MTLPDSIPLRRDSPVGSGFGDGADFSGLAGLGLLLVFAIFAIAWWRKHRAPASDRTKPAADVRPRWARWLGTPHSSAITATGSTRLTPQHSLHEVEWQGKRLLIGCAEHSISLLAEAPITAPDSTSGAPTSPMQNGVAP